MTEGRANHVKHVTEFVLKDSNQQCAPLDHTLTLQNYQETKAMTYSSQCNSYELPTTKGNALKKFMELKTEAIRMCILPGK